MNRVDVVDLAVSLCDGPRSVLFSFGLVAPAVKTEFVCTVFTLGLGPTLVKLNFCVVFFELVRGQPRSVLTAALYHGRLASLRLWFSLVEPCFPLVEPHYSGYWIEAGKYQRKPCWVTFSFFSIKKIHGAS